MRYKGYLGTYSETRSEGIYCFEYDKGKFLDFHLFAPIKNPKFMCLFEDKLAALCDFADGSGLGIFDKQGQLLDQLVFEQKTGTYIVYRKGYFYTANFHEGTFNVISYLDGKLSLEKQVLIQKSAGAHQVLIYNDSYLIPCMNTDELVLIDAKYKIERRIPFPKGSGPRHGVFSHNQEFLYLLGQLNDTLYVLETKSFTFVNELRVLPAAVKTVGDSAAIRLSEDGKHLYTRRVKS